MTVVPTNGNGTSARWQLIVSIAGIIFLVGGALYAFIGTTTGTNLQVSTNTGEIHNLVSQYGLLVERLQTLRSEQATHGADIRGLQKETESLQHSLDVTQQTTSTQAAQVASLQRDLVEIETQFCSEDQKIAIFHAYELRFDSMFFLKSFGQAMPIDNAIYPSVGRCTNGR